MESWSAQVIDLAVFRARSRAGAAPTPQAADESDAQAIVGSLLEAIPNVEEMLVQLLADARRFCVDQLAAALPRYVEDHAATVQLVKRVRTALRRSVPDAFLLEALADAGGVWLTPGASHWPAAWLQHLDPSRRRYLDPAAGDAVQRVVAYLGQRLADNTLPAGGPQSRRAHVLDRVAWFLRQPEALAALGAPGNRQKGTPSVTLRFPRPVPDRATPTSTCWCPCGCPLAAPAMTSW